MLFAYIIAGVIIAGVGALHLINLRLSRPSDQELEVMINHGAELSKVSYYDTESIKNLAKTLQIHKKMGYDDTYNSGIELLSNIVEIIERITVGEPSESKVSHEAYEALAKYGNMARKIDTILGESGFLDMQKNSKKWPDDMSQDIIQAIKDSNESVIEDIIKFNNAKVIDIKVALSAISQDTEKRNSKIDAIFKNNPEIAQLTEKLPVEDTTQGNNLEEEIEYITKSSGQKNTLKNN